jgi:hypothetical protein
MNLKINFSYKYYIGMLKSADYSTCYFNFLGRKSRWLIFLVLILVIGLCGNIWYKYIYNPGWNEGQKKAYIDSKDKGTIFNKSRFNGIVAIQERRRENFEKTMDDVEDIFKLGERATK